VAKSRGEWLVAIHLVPQTVTAATPASSFIVSRLHERGRTGSCANAGKINLNRGIMRALLILAIAVVPAVAQKPAVLLTNSTRPAGTDFQIGERFEIVVTAAANQPVSVRTTMKGRTDWGPVVGYLRSRLCYLGPRRSRRSGRCR
jgi:hypothetical protein